MFTAHEQAAVRSSAVTHEAHRRQRADGFDRVADRRAHAGRLLLFLQPQRSLRTPARGRARDRGPQHRGDPEPGLRPGRGAGERAARRTQRRRSDADRLAQTRAHALRRQQDDADDEQAGRARRRSRNGSRQAIQGSAHQHRFDGLTALHLVYPDHRPGQAHRPPVRARESLGAAGGDARAARASCSAARCVALALAYLLARRVQRQIAAPLLQPGRHHAGRGARRLFASARSVTSRRRDRHAHARLQRHAGQDREPRAGTRAPARASRRRRWSSAPRASPKPTRRCARR